MLCIAWLLVQNGLPRFADFRPSLQVRVQSAALLVLMSSPSWAWFAAPGWRCVGCFSPTGSRFREGSRSDSLLRFLAASFSFCPVLAGLRRFVRRLEARSRFALRGFWGPWYPGASARAPLSGSSLPPASVYGYMYAPPEKARVLPALVQGFHGWRDIFGVSKLVRVLGLGPPFWVGCVLDGSVFFVGCPRRTSAGVGTCLTGVLECVRMGVWESMLSQIRFESRHRRLFWIPA